MPTEKFGNNAVTTLASAITAGATSLTVASASRFPAAGNFRIVIGTEYLLVTAVSGTTFTVTRGIESSTAASHGAGTTVALILTDASLRNNPGPMTATGDLPYLASSGAVARLAVGTAGQVLTVSGGLPTWQDAASGSGTVTSVAASGPAGVLTWSAAVTTSGTLTATFATQSANTVLAGPTSGAAATPAFRALVAADIPDISSIYAKLAVANTFTAAQTVSGAANSLTVAGSTTGNPVTLTATGSDTGLSIKLAPKGEGGFVQIGRDTYGPDANYNIRLELVDFTPGTATNTYGFYCEDVCADKDGALGYGGKFLIRGPSGGTHNIASLYGWWGNAQSRIASGKTCTQLIGVQGSAYTTGGGTVTEAHAMLAEASSDGSTTCLFSSAVTAWVYDAHKNAGEGEQFGFYTKWLKSRTSATVYGLWVGDPAGLATNTYGFWLDSPGVYRIKGDGVTAYYRPDFLPKYTPGATDFERIVQQWSGTTAQYGVEVGGTGTMRPLRLLASSVCFGTDSPSAAACFQLDSTTQAFLPPRMTTTQRDAIASPVAGMVIYNATTAALNVYTTSWGAVGGGSGTVTSVAATAPAAGFTISGSPVTTSGTFTFTLANDLAAVEGLSSTGIAARTATDTWAVRTITGTSGTITVTNGDGVSGNPTLTIDATYVGQTSITTLGTIATGTWSGSTIAANKGGTGVTSASANTVFAGPTSGGATTPAFRSLVDADLPTVSFNRAAVIMGVI